MTGNQRISLIPDEEEYPLGTPREIMLRRTEEIFCEAMLDTYAQPAAALPAGQRDALKSQLLGIYTTYTANPATARSRLKTIVSALERNREMGRAGITDFLANLFPLEVVDYSVREIAPFKSPPSFADKVVRSEPVKKKPSSHVSKHLLFDTLGELKPLGENVRAHFSENGHRLDCAHIAKRAHLSQTLVSEVLVPEKHPKEIGSRRMDAKVTEPLGNALEKLLGDMGKSEGDIAKFRTDFETLIVNYRHIINKAHAKRHAK